MVSTPLLSLSTYHHYICLHPTDPMCSLICVCHGGLTELTGWGMMKTVMVFTPLLSLSTYHHDEDGDGVLTSTYRHNICLPPTDPMCSLICGCHGGLTELTGWGMMKTVMVFTPLLSLSTYHHDEDGDGVLTSTYHHNICLHPTVPMCSLIYWSFLCLSPIHASFFLTETYSPPHHFSCVFFKLCSFLFHVCTNLDYLNTL